MSATVPNITVDFSNRVQNRVVEYLPSPNGVTIVGTPVDTTTLVKTSANDIIQLQQDIATLQDQVYKLSQALFKLTAP